ncbi:MAG TPA: DUF748 domain-containing protein, partial [Spirochaetota bacterium]|nr:DUF748 domain-containing protein [Spirochaetota bacterium]
KIELEPNVVFDTVEKSLIGSGIVNFEKASILHKDTPVFKIEKFECTIDKLIYPKSFISLKNLNIEASYANLVIKEDKKLYLFSIFPLLTSEKKDTNKNSINIDNAFVLIKNLSFTDYSLKKKFIININNINCLIKNYPSTVYPEGTLAISGNINNVNNFNLVGNIGGDTGFSGKFSTNGLLLMNISDLSENYLGYSLVNGYADIDSKIIINEQDLRIDTKLKLKNLRLKNESSKLKLDIEKIITKLEDTNGIMEINIPVKGTLNKPNIDFRKIFFDLFIDIIGNTTKEFSETFTDFVKDDSYEIIYFKSGLAEPISSENIFSTEMIKKFTDSKKYFQIEGYVDKVKDALYLKQNILNEKIEFYKSPINSVENDDELKILERIYSDLTGKSSGINDISELKKSIIDIIIIPDGDWYALSYKRVNSIKKILMDKYNISEDRIGMEEKNIFENSYIQGIGNNIGIVFSGRKRK